MKLVTVALLLPPALVFLTAVVLAFFITLHRRRERAWANTSPSVYVPGKVRTIQTPLYDTYTVAASAAVVPAGTLRMFGNVQGVGGIGPNITNMTQAFQLQGGQSWLISAMRFVFLGCALADVNSFFLGFTCRFIVGAGKVTYGDAPAEYWAGGAGAYGGTSAAATNGIPDPRAIVPFDVDPVLLTDGVNFEVDVVGTSFAATAAFAVRVYLDGQQTSPAQ